MTSRGNATSHSYEVKPLRIGFFVWEYPPIVVGGLGTYAENIARKYVEMGHDVTVFTLNTGGLPAREIIRGVEVHRPMIADATNVFPLFVSEDLRRWGTSIKFFNDVFVYNVLSATKFINELVRKEKYQYDVFCIHDWLSSVSGLIIKNELKIPMVFHVHSTEWGRSSGGGSEVVTHLERAAAESADAVITVSHAMKEDMARHGWEEKKIHVVWNGVDPDRYDPDRYPPDKSRKIRERYNIQDDEQMILFVGRLTWVKGVQNIIKAMPLFSSEFPKSKVVILGKGEAHKDLMTLADRLGVADHISYRFEFISEEERILHYAASDVCVFPSIYEPFGIVSLEAMSMKKPVVVGARGIVGFAEQVVPSGPDQNGVHINGNDPSDIAWGIKEVLRDPARAKLWGENGRKLVLKYFTWDKTAEQTIKVYEALKH